MKKRAILSGALLFAMALPITARELHWDALDVRAVLQSNGSLRVIERHEMVFTGDWNGGERTFDLRPGQSVDVHAIRRIDGARVVEMVQGDLGEVDHWQRMGDAVRWRSRRPEDPPFDDTSLVYEIVYTLHRPLQSNADGYRIDHEAVLLDRDGVIEEFTLQFDVEPPWTANVPLPVHASASNLAPGDGWQLELDLRRSDGSAIDDVILQLSPLQKGAGAAAILLAAAALFAMWRRHERRAGRLGPLPSITSAEAESAFRDWKPETMGAAWDEKVGAPEVAAVLARLEAEGKISSSVKKNEGDDELLLDLLVPRDQFEGYDRTLVDGLFVSGDQTSTKMVREHYEGKGYDPSSAIREGVLAEVARHSEWSADVSRWGCLWATLPWLVGAFIAVVIGLVTPAKSDLVMAAVFFSFLICVFGSIPAFVTSRNARASGGTAVAWNIVPLLGVSFLIAFIVFAPELENVWELAALVCLAVFTYASIATAARTMLSAPRLRLRRWLLALREWVSGELEKPQPALRDEWMPHILALGLGRDVDRWFGTVAAGTAAGVTARRIGSTSGSSGSSSASGPGGSWSGGGTSFGGGGATGAWVAAATTMAAGVASPSSSGGSGGGGGSSSGGGGGGGW